MNTKYFIWFIWIVFIVIGVILILSSTTFLLSPPVDTSASLFDQSAPVMIGIILIAFGVIQLVRSYNLR